MYPVANRELFLKFIWDSWVKKNVSEFNIKFSILVLRLAKETGGGFVYTFVYPHARHTHCRMLLRRYVRGRALYLARVNFALNNLK